MKVMFSLRQWLMVMAALVLSTRAQVKEALKGLGRGVQKEISAIKDPIDKTIAYVGSSQCTNVKKLLGVDYEQVDGIKEPDVNDLTLNFVSQVLNVTYNLTTAAQVLSESREIYPSDKLVIYLHGFTDNPGTNNFGAISDAFLKTGKYNILGLDASSLIRWLYLRSTTYVRFIGERLGEVLAAMVQRGLEPKYIHIIGHSLGAHIAGFTGKQFLNTTGLKLGRISGLDPAGPCFSNVDPELRLKATDADFVDVIHTDGGVYGLTDPVGHVDFYPNSGSQQPNCLLQTCSHSRVNQLYAESVLNPQAFPAKACNDWDAFKEGNCSSEVSVMGYGCKAGTRGRYYLRTGEDPPYGLAEEGLEWVNNEGIVNTIGSAVFG